MKIKTKEDYQKRHKPPPKKGKSRKVSLEKESNACLWNRIVENERRIDALEFTARVLDKALGQARMKCPYSPEHYCAEAEAEILKEMKAGD